MENRQGAMGKCCKAFIINDLGEEDQISLSYNIDAVRNSTDKKTVWIATEPAQRQQKSPPERGLVKAEYTVITL
jgi:hypothetical protein